MLVSGFFWAAKTARFEPESLISVMSKVTARSGVLSQFFSLEYHLQQEFPTSGT